MQVTFNLDDKQVLDMTKMVNVGFLVDKAYKAVKPQIVQELTHIRKTISSFDMWFEKLNPTEQDHVRHSMNSTISVEEIDVVPEENHVDKYVFVSKIGLDIEAYLNIIGFGYATVYAILLAGYCVICKKFDKSLSV